MQNRLRNTSPRRGRSILDSSTAKMVPVGKKFILRTTVNTSDKTAYLAQKD